MWWNIIKVDILTGDNWGKRPSLKEVHVQDVINEVVQEMANNMGIQDLDLRFKDRLISAGITVDNDGNIPIKEFIIWLKEDNKYIQRMTPTFQDEIREELLETSHIIEDPSTWDIEYRLQLNRNLYIEKVKEVLLVIVEIEDEATSPLEYRQLFGNRGEGNIHQYRQVQLNQESSQRHPPEEDT